MAGHGHGHGHSHDGMDWGTKLQELRGADALAAPEHQTLASTLVGPGTRSVIEIGCGAGGMAAALGAALPAGAALTVVDSAPELLDAAAQKVRDTAPEVAVNAVLWDAASDEIPGELVPADLVFSSLAVHHLPDQLAGLRRLVGLTRPGGAVAIVEMGLPQRVLPWDVGVGEPGLEDRLSRCQAGWFQAMRTGMDGSVRMPTGWSRALADSGLTGVRTWSYLVDRPAPVSDLVMRRVLHHLARLGECAAEYGAADDARAVEALLDENGPHYVGRRDDVYFLLANTVHTGIRP